VDGAYLRALAKVLDKPLPSVHGLCWSALVFYPAGEWLHGGLELTRVNVYDAASPDEEPSADLKTYWESLEHEIDTRMSWGFLRRSAKAGRRQKGVDVLLALEMMVGAVDDAYDIGLLVAADGDFVPLLEEVRRRGKRVALAASISPNAPVLSADLRRNCDLFISIEGSWLEAVGPPIEKR
jgi:uncharacterized LabA/DUF88 family protein